MFLNPSINAFIIPFLGTIFVCAIGGLLSPLIVLKQRSYLGDTLAHLIFPGVVVGIFASEFFHLNNQLCTFIGAFITAVFGTYLSEWFLNKLKIPPDSSAMVCLSAFFALGILLISWTKQEAIDPENLLFGDILALNLSNIITLAIVFGIIAFIIFFYRKHWNAWLTDPEFAKIAGFKIKMMDRLFPMLVTISVLAGFFAVGGLMISALITLPAIFCQPRSAISLSTLVFSMCLGVCGFLLAMLFSLPVGPVLVLFGFLCVVVKSMFTQRINRAI